MIERLEKFSEEEEILEGVFKSKIFQNDIDNELTIYLENGDIIDYAEECIKHLNNMSNGMVDLICKSIIKCYNVFGGLNKDFKLPKLRNHKEILKYCWFTNITVEVPQTDETAYTVSGESDWEECICFTIKDNNVIYVGREQVSPWEDIEKYNQDNCIHLKV